MMYGLVLAPRVPLPADYGAAQRNSQILRYLRERHQITMVTFGTSPLDPREGDVSSLCHRAEILPLPVRSLRHRLLQLGRSWQPDLADRLYSPAFVERLRGVLRERTPDLVQIEGLEMFSLWSAATSDRNGRGPVVILDEHNAEYLLQRSVWKISLQQRRFPGAAYSLLQWRRLRRYERWACAQSDGVIAVSGEDQHALHRLVHDLRTVVIPNGVDTSCYRRQTPPTSQANILFLGKLDYRPNVDAVQWIVREVWPRVFARRPDARLLIVGRDPSPAVLALGTTPGVQVVGPVVDDRACYETAALCIVPLRMGSGVRLKVLQAMSMEVPVISTTLGMSGVAAQDGVHYRRADRPLDFAVAIEELLGNSSLRDRFTQQARQLVERDYDWRVLLPRLDSFYAEFLRAR